MILIVITGNHISNTLHEKVLLGIVRYLPRGYFHIDKEYPLSPAMLLALKKANYKQKRGKRYGPVDIKKSFNSLIERGLVSYKYYNNSKGEKKSSWQITRKGMLVLKVNHKKD